MSGSASRAWVRVVSRIGAVAVLAGAAVLGIYGAVTGNAWAALVAVILALLALPLVGRSRYRSRLIPVLEFVVPVLRVLREQRDHAHECGRLVAQLDDTLSAYGLGPIDSALREELIADLVGPDLVGQCTRRIAEELPPASRHLTGPVLELLHRERMGEKADLDLIWQHRDKDLVERVAAILDGSERLPEFDDGFGVARNRLVELLDSLPEFSVAALEEQIARAHSIWEDCGRYAEYLRDNLLDHAAASGCDIRKFGPGSVFKRLGESGHRPIRELPAARAQILAQFGDEVLARCVPALLGRPRAVTLVSLAILFGRRMGGRDKECALVCREAGDLPDAVTLAIAYLEFKEVLKSQYVLVGRPYVSLDYLIVNWTAKIAERRRQLADVFERDLFEVKTSLRRGEWHDRLTKVLDQRLENKARDLADVAELAQEKPATVESLRRVFRGLRLPTIERYLEARRINAYLLTFDSRRGELATLIGCLSDPEKLLEAGVEPQVAGRPKYVLKQYTPSARIGVIPQGWSYEEFHAVFQKDFDAIVANRNRLFTGLGRFEGIEVVMQRFGLQDYYAFTAAGKPSEKASEQIKELFAGILSDTEMISLIGYELEEKKTITEGIMEGPIAELAGKEIKFLDEELELLEDDADRRLKQALLREMGLVEISELAREIHDPPKREEARERLAELLQDLDPLTIDRPRGRRMADAYLGTLEAVGRISEP